MTYSAQQLCIFQISWGLKQDKRQFLVAPQRFGVCHCSWWDDCCFIQNYISDPTRAVQFYHIYICQPSFSTISGTCWPSISNSAGTLSLGSATLILLSAEPIEHKSFARLIFRNLNPYFLPVNCSFAVLHFQTWWLITCLLWNFIASVAFEVDALEMAFE